MYKEVLPGSTRRPRLTLGWLEFFYLHFALQQLLSRVDLGDLLVIANSAITDLVLTRVPLREQQHANASAPTPHSDMLSSCWNRLLQMDLPGRQNMREA